MSTAKEKEAAYKTWLASLKPGDEVVIPAGYSEVAIVKIERMTPTQIIIRDGLRFRRVDGGLVGRIGAAAKQPTPELREQAEGRELFDWLERLMSAAFRDRSKRPTLAQLRAMKAAYESA